MDVVIGALFGSRAHWFGSDALVEYLPHPIGLTADADVNKFVKWLGLEADDGTSNQGVHELGALVPGWFAVVATSVLPAVWVAKWRRRRRFGPGFCSGCGYDLRATPENCPECGRVVERPGEV